VLARRSSESASAEGATRLRETEGFARFSRLKNQKQEQNTTCWHVSRLRVLLPKEQRD